MKSVRALVLQYMTLCNSMYLTVELYRLIFYLYCKKTSKYTHTQTTMQAIY